MTFLDLATLLRLILHSAPQVDIAWLFNPPLNNFVIKEHKASWYTVYLLVNTILMIKLHLQMLYRQLEDQQVAPPTIFISGAKSVL